MGDRLIGVAEALSLVVELVGQPALDAALVVGEVLQLAEEEAVDTGQAVYLVDTHAREQRLKHGEQTAVVRLG